MFAESVDLMVFAAMVSLGENKDWIGTWITSESPKITFDMSFLHVLSPIPVSRLKPILDEADHRSLRPSDWFKLKMIMSFSFNKLFPGLPPLPPKTQFIKIKFVNQGLDLLNISNIFRDHRVTSKIPQYFENLDSPLICYQYNNPIRNIIFNYNQVTSNPDVLSSIQPSWSCVDSPFLYHPAGHVVRWSYLYSWQRTTVTLWERA